MNEIREKEIKNKIYRGLEQYIYIHSNKIIIAEEYCACKNTVNKLYHGVRKNIFKEISGIREKNQEQNISWSGTIYMYTRTKL